MKDIINIEDRLHIIKQLFELQIKIGADVGFIHLCTENQSWAPNHFRAECIEANLNDIKQHKILEDILNLSNEIINIYDKLPKPKNHNDKDFFSEDIDKYRLDFTPSGRHFSRLTLTKKEDHKRYYYHIEDNRWELMPQGYWEDYPKTNKSFEEWNKGILENKSVMTNNFFLIDFVVRINSFLKESVFIKPQSSTVFLSTACNIVRMTEIHQYLKKYKYIDVDEVVGSWLYWFSLQSWQYTKKNPTKIKWIGAAYVLTNVVYILCGNMTKETEQAMKNAFVLPKGKKFQKKTNIDFSKKPYKSIREKINFAERFIKDSQ